MTRYGNWNPSQPIPEREESDPTPPNTESDKSIDDLIDKIFAWAEDDGDYMMDCKAEAKKLLYSLLMDVIGDDLPLVQSGDEDMDNIDYNVQMVFRKAVNWSKAEERIRLTKLFNKETDK